MFLCVYGGRESKGRVDCLWLSCDLTGIPAAGWSIWESLPLAGVNGLAKFHSAGSYLLLLTLFLLKTSEPVFGACKKWRTLSLESLKNYGVISVYFLFLSCASNPKQYQWWKYFSFPYWIPPTNIPFLVQYWGNSLFMRTDSTLSVYLF